MCQSIRFKINGQPIVFSFTDPKPCLPLLTIDGHIKIIPWGRVEGSGPPPYPPGKTAFISDVKSQWKHFKPRSVRIGCEAFLMRDSSGQEKWYEIKSGYIAGVVATAFDDHRAYVLMRQRELIDPPGHNEWPIYVQT
jgi:hypothetical protein